MTTMANRLPFDLSMPASLLFLGFVSNCAGAAMPPAQRPAIGRVSAQTDTDATPQAVGSQTVVRQRITASAGPSNVARVVIHNSFLTTQYVFVNSAAQGMLLPTAEQTLEVTPGAHTVTISDSASGDQNPQHIAEVFDSGFDYRYEVLAR